MVAFSKNLRREKRKIGKRRGICVSRKPSGKKEKLETSKIGQKGKLCNRMHLTPGGASHSRKKKKKCNPPPPSVIGTVSFNFSKKEKKSKYGRK